MLRFKLFDNKGYKKDRLGNNILNLANNTIVFSGDIRIKDIVVVTNEFEMRIDKVSSVIYGTDEKCDVLLKYNGISNPFSLESGTVLFCPELTNVKYKDRTKTKTSSIANQYVDKLSQKDLKRLESIAQKTKNKNRVDQPLPPNLSQEGDQEIKIVDGLIIFGDDVSKNVNKCKTPKTRAEYVSNLIKNRLRKNNLE